MMSASNRSAIRPVMTLNDPLACVRSKAIGAPVQESVVSQFAVAAVSDRRRRSETAATIQTDTLLRNQNA
jgi:hypothetical protein